MLTHVDVVSENTMTLPILGATTKEPILIRSITGLNPPDIDLFVGDYARDGGVYQGRRVGPKNPVMAVELNPNPALGQTVSGLREMLYKMLLDPVDGGDGVRLVFHDSEMPDRFLDGWVEKFETELFAAQNVAAISFICPDPYLRDVDVTSRTYASGGVTETPEFLYRGSAETGLVVELSIVKDTPAVTVDLNGTKLTVGYPMTAGSTLSISTVPGNRFVTLYETPTNGRSILGGVTPASKWPTLRKLTNKIQIYGATPASTPLLPAKITSLSYRAAYWGA